MEQMMVRLQLLYAGFLKRNKHIKGLSITKCKTRIFDDSIDDVPIPCFRHWFEDTRFMLFNLLFGGVV
jgi:hypothetical protein